MFRKILKGLLLAVLLPGAVFLVYLAFMTVTDYRPAGTIALDIADNQAERLKRGEPLSIVTFNIGYAGLDAGEDFFMDGGVSSRCRSLPQTLANLKNIAAFLSGQKADLLLLQEVDACSSRSFRVDELAYLRARLAGHGAVFALNYKVPWVPVPVTRPMGAVRSGLLTLSRFRVGSAARIRLPGREPWPRQLAELDRCAVESRLPLQGGGELLLINVHLSVFDKGGRIRKLQLADLRKRITGAYGRGDHVIVGGDWNHGLPGSDPGLFRWTVARPGWYMPLPEDFAPPGFSWAVDRTVPSIRSTGSAYKKGENFVAVIDGFLVSDNIDVLNVRGRDLDFRDSDHNPVTAVLVLK
jgi:endonuclease/exonuclease/phosphatase family metal-dependent hydrolase